MWIVKMQTAVIGNNNLEASSYLPAIQTNGLVNNNGMGVLGPNWQQEIPPVTPIL